MSRPSRGGRLRLTRRGRAVLLGFYLLVAIGLAVILAPSSRAADPPGPAPTAVVLPGDTLWSVAERHRPSRQPFRMIDEIRRLNGIEGYTIHAGQRLTLPREE
ncbi:LysM peptidoglycan-binding domain-containing protein [Micromonospora sp. NPDC050397]|uniref:LysM peptidoglycan-binding domain-containing protein n=1 Tax=Micromonospora sp. NPDC050397 TaxID=3364279 RepID=UPI003850BBAB